MKELKKLLIGEIGLPADNADKKVVAPVSEVMCAQNTQIRGL
jgi:hypothetical protein